MDAKIIEREGKYVVQTRKTGAWEDDGKPFATMADAEAHEAELKLAEANPDMPKREVKQTAKATVSRSAAQERQAQAEDRAEEVSKDAV